MGFTVCCAFRYVCEGCEEQIEGKGERDSWLFVWPSGRVRCKRGLLGEGERDPSGNGPALDPG